MIWNDHGFSQVSKLQAPLYVGPPGIPEIELQRVVLAPNRTWTFSPDLNQNGHAPVFALGTCSLHLDLCFLDVKRCYHSF